MAFDVALLREMEAQGREFFGCCPPTDQREFARIDDEGYPERARIEQPGGCWHMRRNPCTCICHRPEVVNG